MPITHDGSGRASIVVPNEPGTQIQIIGEVTDDGDPALTTYQRYLIDVGRAYVKPVATRPADSIDFSAPTTISGDSDVSTNGQLVKAVNLTSDAAGFNVPVTVNGVTFAASPFVGSTTTLAGADTMFATDSAPISGQLNRVLAGASTALGGADRQPFASLSESYRSLLQTGFYNDADESVANVRLGNYSIPERYTERAGYDLTLTGLTPGVPYEVQLFVNDYRTTRIGSRSNPNLTTIVRDQGGQVSLRHNAAGTDGIDRPVRHRPVHRDGRHQGDPARRRPGQGRHRPALGGAERLPAASAPEDRDRGRDRRRHRARHALAHPRARRPPSARSSPASRTTTPRPRPPTSSPPPVTRRCR